jgi:hypothetical protein
MRMVLLSGAMVAAFACGAVEASAQTMTNKQMISRLRQSGVQICINCERACARCRAECFRRPAPQTRSCLATRCDALCPG